MDDNEFPNERDINHWTHALIIPFEDEETAKKFYHHLVELTYIEGWVQSVDDNVKEQLVNWLKQLDHELGEFR